MKKILSYFVILFALCFAMSAVPQASADLLPTTFQLRFEDSELDSTPLVYREVYVYSGDYEFKGGFNPYFPCNPWLKLLLILARDVHEHLGA